MTRAPLTVDRLAPNRALKEAIDAFRAANPGAVAKVVPKPLRAGAISVTAEAFAREGPCGTHDIVFTLDSGAGRERSPLDLVCVIDISGSMQNEASVSDEKGVKEEHGLSLLDITKHAVATVIHTLGPNDRLSLVSYSDKARVELALTAMNKEGQKMASSVLEKLHTEGSTNLWDGLLKGMETLRAVSRDGRIPSVFLLTDGQPNVAPPRGHLEMLKRYKDEHKIAYTVNTFGFGYNLDSHLLDELATEGGGAYAFVPEPTFVGTCFVNALANSLVVAGSDASIAVENVNGATFSAVLGGHPVAEASWGFKASLGTLQFGQQRQLVVRADLSKVPEGKAFVNATLTYVDRSGEQATVEASGTKISGAITPEAASHYARSVACTAMRDVMTLMAKGPLPQAQAIIERAVATVKGLVMGNKNTGELLKDLEGQATEATSRTDWWTKWGRHYLPSLCRAHQLQQANNFKDFGVQCYGGDLFQKLRDMADAVFLKLPPPKPTIKKNDGSSYHQMASMAAYNNSAAVCFSPDSLVLLADGTQRRCDEMRPGDLVFGGGMVLCIVKTHSLNGQQALVQLSATMKVTPWHPVLHQKTWNFPIHCAAVAVQPCEATYNFVLDKSHTMVIGGVTCVTLGHGIVDESSGDVRASQYWGRDVVADLQSMPGYARGLVEIRKPAIERSPETGLVARLVDVAN